MPLYLKREFEIISIRGCLKSNGSVFGKGDEKAVALQKQIL
jgi:hypothetical protein